MASRTESRRHFMKGAVTLVLGSQLPIRRALGTEVRVVVIDSRLPGILASGPAAGRVVDVAAGDMALWKSLRNVGKHEVHGMTTWADFLAARGLLEHQGLRLMSEAMRDSVVHWKMA